jgi:small subunit ribosomal protein S8
MNDTVSDLIIRIKNAYMAHHKEVVLPATKLREAIVKLMVEQGYLTSFVREAGTPQDTLKLELRYVKGKPALTDVERLSKPGRRVYQSVDKLPKVLGGYGIAVISTSKGILSDAQAREAGVGGELLFKAW